MNGDVQDILTGLLRQRGVRAAQLSMLSDGLAVAGAAAYGIDEDALAAFTTALVRRARLANAAAGYGETAFLTLDASRGLLLIAVRDDLLIAVMATRDAQAGIIRVELQRAMGKVASAVGALREG